MATPQQTWLGMVCPHCKDTKQVTWRFTAERSNKLREYWWAKCFCKACGSRWACWPWWEHRTGQAWRRISARNPGNFTADQIAVFVIMRRQYTEPSEGYSIRIGHHANALDLLMEAE